MTRIGFGGVLAMAAFGALGTSSGWCGGSPGSRRPASPSGLRD
ncbi:MAG TPA: hypothetical protein VMU94_11780 [Streptosporangiaceae bacterium]|nr:hypothetical protein [Streptosporangiaceae bacterium]